MLKRPIETVEGEACLGSPIVKRAALGVSTFGLPGNYFDAGLYGIHRPESLHAIGKREFRCNQTRPA
jgi:hypothetical protein